MEHLEKWIVFVKVHWVGIYAVITTILWLLSEILNKIKSVNANTPLDVIQVIISVLLNKITNKNIDNK